MTVRAWQTLVVALVFAVAAAATSMFYANRVAAQAGQRWCGIVTTLDDAYRQTPPQTPAGRKIARDIRQLRADFDCP